MHPNVQLRPDETRLQASRDFAEAVFCYEIPVSPSSSQNLRQGAVITPHKPLLARNSLRLPVIREEHLNSSTAYRVTSTESRLSTQVALNYGSSLQIQRRSPASERLLLPVEFRHNELAEFHCSGRNVTIGDPPYA